MATPMSENGSATALAGSDGQHRYAAGQPSLESLMQARRKGVRRTALLMGGVALVIFTLSLLQMYK